LSPVLLACATGAAAGDGPADTFANDYLVLQPVDGPNGRCGYLDDEFDRIAVRHADPVRPLLGPSHLTNA
jgi:hypothetical protein